MAEDDVRGRPNGATHTSNEWIYLDGTALSSDVNLITSRPSYSAAQKVALRPRMLIPLTAGNLVTTRSDETNVGPHPVVAGMPMPCSPTHIVASGTTITGLLVFY